MGFSYLNFAYRYDQSLGEWRRIWTLTHMSLPAVLLLSFTALTLLISHDWRVLVSALGLMYVGVFILVLSSWSLEMAVVKLVAGWISASVLGISMVSLSPRQHLQIRYFPSEIIFRISASGLVGLVTISLAPGIQEWFQRISYEQAIGGLILIGMSLLHLGFTRQPLRTSCWFTYFFCGL